MIEIDGEVYHTAKSAAVYLGITRFLFYSNVKENLRAHRFATRKRLYYKQSDLVPLRDVIVVAA